MSASEMERLQPGLVAQRTDVEPHLRTDDEKRELFPRLELLSDYLCQTQTYVFAALNKAGLTVVPLDPSARENAPAESASLRERLREVEGVLREAREALREAFFVIGRQNPLSIPVVGQIDIASARIDAALSAQQPTPEDAEGGSQKGEP